MSERFFVYVCIIVADTILIFHKIIIHSILDIVVCGSGCVRDVLSFVHGLFVHSKHSALHACEIKCIAWTFMLFIYFFGFRCCGIILDYRSSINSRLYKLGALQYTEYER